MFYVEPYHSAPDLYAGARAALPDIVRHRAFVNIKAIGEREQCLGAIAHAPSHA